MSDLTLTTAGWVSFLAQSTAQTRATAWAGWFPSGASIDFLDAGGATIRTVTTGAWTVGAVQSGYYPVVPGAYTDAAAGGGTAVTAVFRDGATERFRCTVGVRNPVTQAIVRAGFYLLAGEIVAGVPIRRGGFAILIGPPPTAGVPEVPVNTALPAISPAVAYVGTTLTCSTGAWSNSPTAYAYQWYRDGSPVAGATNSQYTVPAGASAAAIRCHVTASNAAGSGTTAVSNTRDVFGLRSVPSPIALQQGASLDLSSYVVGGSPPYSGWAIDSGSWPGVSVSAAGVLSASGSATIGTSGDLSIGVDDSATASSADWVSRSTAAGVVWAHNFEADAELYNFVRGDPGSGTVTNPDPALMPNGLYLEATPFGSSRAIVGRAVGTTFTQATPSGTAGDIHTFHVADASQLPNPSPQYRLLIGDPSDPQKGCFEYVDFLSRDLVNNTISVRRRRTSETMPADPVSVAYPGAPSYPIGWTIGRGPMGSWNRPMAAFPAGQNGKLTADVGIANGTVTKARVWNPTRGGNGHLSFREGYWGSRHYWDTAVNPSAPYRNWTPADPADNTTRADAWDGDEFYLQFRFKCSASRLTEYATKLLYIQNAFNSGTGQIFAAVGEKKFNEQPAPGEAAPGVTYGRFMQWLCGGGDSRQPAGGYLFSDFQGDGNDQGSNAYQLGYPACNYTNRSGSGMYCWCYPAEEWVTVLVHVKFGRDNAELSASPTPPWLSASDPTFRTLFEVSVVSPGETTYRKLISIPDATWFFGDSIGDLQNYFYNPPGLNAVWLTQELNSYIGAGSVAPPTESHSIAFTEAILSTQPIPAPAV